MAVNLAGPCVMDVGIPGAIADLLADHRVAADMLTLEISERTMMHDVARALPRPGRLRGLGVRLSLDDFGTGQTSLGQLRQLPLTEMKVDRSLVVGDERLLASVVEIAHKFGLRAVGEGVETRGDRRGARGRRLRRGAGLPVRPADVGAGHPGVDRRAVRRRSGLSRPPHGNRPTSPPGALS